MAWKSSPSAAPSQRPLAVAVPAAASVANPVDLLASASPEDYRRALSLLLADPSIDAVLVLYVPVLSDRGAAVAAALMRRNEAGARHADSCDLPRREGLACVAQRGYRHLRFPRRPHGRWRGWRAMPPGAAGRRACTSASPISTHVRARAIVERAADAGRGWLPPDEVRALLDAAGIAQVGERFVRTERDALEAARQVGFPVAVKAVGPTIVHKTDIGGVVLGLGSEADVAGAWRSLAERLGPRLEGVVVQAMAPDGVEMLVGAVQHPMFGPLLACGAGGTLAEILRDTAFRLTPLTDVDATEIIRSLKSARLLQGYRGRPPSDERACATHCSACRCLSRPARPSRKSISIRCACCRMARWCSTRACASRSSRPSGPGASGTDVKE